VTADQRIQNAREYLGYARQVTVADLPHSALMRMAAELRRQLGLVLDVIAEEEGPAGQLRRWQLTVRQAFIDAIRWQEERATPDTADQVALYVTVARCQLYPPSLRTSPPEPGSLPRRGRPSTPTSPVSPASAATSSPPRCTGGTCAAPSPRSPGCSGTGPATTGCGCRSTCSRWPCSRSSASCA
jgi:hypothetical protein